MSRTISPLRCRAHVGRFCPCQYPEQGCWFMTGNSVGPDGTWQNCEADEGTPPGVANGKTYSQVRRPISLR